MKQPMQSKALNVLLVTSMIWLGAGAYIPIAYAETTTAPIEENQLESTLSKLEIEGIKLDQLFSTDVKEYSATVKNDVQSIKLLVESNKTDAAITINGQTVLRGVVGDYLLNTGENKFLITVNDGSNITNTYTLTVIREENANNLLQSINVSQGQLTPTFSSEVTEYKVDVPNAVPSITIKPTTVVATSTIKVNEKLVTNEGIIVKIPVGKKVDINIIVTAENGVKKTYTLHITRAAAVITNNPKNNTKPSTSQTPSQPTTRPNSSQPTSPQQNTTTVEKTSTALLSSLSVSEGTWDSTFSSEEFTYHISLSSSVDEVTLTPVAKYSSSEILIEGSTSKTIKLEDDMKTIISVIVKHNDDRKTYVLVFDKES